MLSDGRWKHYKNISPIWEDNLDQFGESKLIIAHARSAFRDKDIRVENNMPFYDDQKVFVFNGELRGVKIKADGRIGAEKIFNFINRFDKGNYLYALKKGAGIIRQRTSYLRALNIIVTDGISAFVHSEFNEDHEYFQIWRTVNNGKLIICSDPLDGIDGWEKIENKSTERFG